MKILVTGYSGFVGKKLISKLKKEKVEIYYFGRKKVFNNFIKLNYNFKNIYKILNKIKPDIIINLAAVVDFSKELKNMNFINWKLPKYLADYCKKNKKYLIHTSGTLVHGINNEFSIKTSYKPTNYYAKSKLRGDKAIIKSKCNFLILRLPGIFGYNGPKHLLINNLIRAKFQRKKIIFKGNLDSKRNYIFVNDVVNLILKNLKKKVKGISYFGGETLSFKEMLFKIEKFYNPENKFIYRRNSEKLNDQIIIPNTKFSFTNFSKALKIIKYECSFSS